MLEQKQSQVNIQKDLNRCLETKMKTFQKLREDAAKHMQHAKDHYYGASLAKKHGDEPEHKDTQSDHTAAAKAHRKAAAMSRRHGNTSPQYKQAAKAAKTTSKDAMSNDGHHDLKKREPRYHDSMNDLKKSLRGK